MKLSQLPASFLLSALVAGVIASAAWGEDAIPAVAGPSAASSSASNAANNTTQLKFSDPTKPGTLKINVYGGDLKIKGADAPDIIVVSDAKPTGRKRSDGLRVLSASETFSISEKGNVATLEAGMGRHHSSGTDYHITVPRNTSVIVENRYGDTSCAGVSGDIEVNSSNGSVTLKEVVAGASVETMNGPIRVTVKELKSDHALSFSSMNGEVVIHLPATAQANLDLRTQNGQILTDFDDKDLVAKATSSGPGAGAGADSYRDQARKIADVARAAAETARDQIREALDHDGPMAPMAPLPPLPPMTGGQTVSGVLHGGGTQVQAATMNGDVTVRKE